MTDNGHSSLEGILCQRWSWISVKGRMEWGRLGQMRMGEGSSLVRRGRIPPFALLLYCIICICTVILERVSLCRPGWPGPLRDPPASASSVLGLIECTPTPGRIPCSFEEKRRKERVKATFEGGSLETQASDLPASNSWVLGYWYGYRYPIWFRSIF